MTAPGPTEASGTRRMRMPTPPIQENLRSSNNRVPDGSRTASLISKLSVRRIENCPGDLLLLERKFSWLGGVGIRIRRVALASVVPGAVIDGPAIFNADLGNEIDNMEGIDAHVTGEGDTVLTLISDDNFSMIQRNLLLQFTLVE